MAKTRAEEAAAATVSVKWDSIEQAQFAALKALQVNPGNAPAAVNLGISLQKLSSPVQAMLAMEHATTLDGGSFAAWHYLSRLQEEWGEPVGCCGGSIGCNLRARGMGGGGGGVAVHLRSRVSAWGLRNRSRRNTRHCTSLPVTPHH
jgi:hypothetical protein